MNRTRQLLEGTPYVGYAYSYPHKSAYRVLDPPVPLAEVWAEERTDSLFLYLHVPFCEFRCGFCNLFTLANAEPRWVESYLHQLRSEASAMADVVPQACYTRMAIGGGTPTFLSERDLACLLEVAGDLVGGSAGGIPGCCEASPATLTAEKARLLREWGIERLSLGVQSFDDRESRGMGRPQRLADVQRAIDVVRGQGFPTLNLDLIYGSEGQTLPSWLATVARAIDYRAEEIYLYPLYVRELTGLGRSGVGVGDDRLEHYRRAREALLAAGYEQVSMRMFRLPLARAEEDLPYSCQSDGMMGIGCGARSYTQRLHYSREFAVGRAGVRTILQDYLQSDPHSFYFAHHGYRLDEAEQQRRYVLQGILQVAGLSLRAYQERFGSSVWEDLPELADLVAAGLLEVEADQLCPTPAGLERSDAIGPWLYSPRVAERMEAFECA